MPSSPPIARFQLIRFLIPSGSHSVTEEILARNLSADHAVRELRDRLPQARAAGDSADARIVWDRLHLYAPSGNSHFRVAPHDIDDRPAGAVLMRAALRAQWPRAAFSLGADGTRRHIGWLDGPTESEVRDFLVQLDMYRHHVRPKRLLLRRLYGLTAWNRAAAAVESALALTVPRTSTGEIDWPATLSRPIAGPVTIAGHVYICPGSSHYDLGDLVRRVAAHA